MRLMHIDVIDLKLGLFGTHTVCISQCDHWTVSLLPLRGVKRLIEIEVSRAEREAAIDQ
jgi:hypothetical protein